ncbi:hypothetical protein [Flavobacterium sp.]|uniref:hypothetical protein n=1 Tax=Flavobacterium sp. TaxID=239 RepID=UPI00286DF566|nr:hypothetical protein [Flavobacterium sp.]
MKNTALKFYITAAFLCSTFALFAGGVPGDESDTGDLQGGDATPPSPIDNYVLVLAIVGLLFAYFKFRSMYKNSIQG